MSVDFSGMSDKEVSDKLEELHRDGELRSKLSFKEAKQAAEDCGLGKFSSWGDLEVVLGGTTSGGGGSMSGFSFGSGGGRGSGRGSGGGSGRGESFSLSTRERERDDRDGFGFGLGGNRRGGRVERGRDGDRVAKRSKDPFMRGSMQSYLFGLYGAKDVKTIENAFSYDSEVAVKGALELTRNAGKVARDNYLCEDDKHELKAILDALIEFVELIAANRKNTAWSRLSIRLRNFRREVERMVWGSLERVWG